MKKKQRVEVRLKAMELEDLDMLYYVENDRSLWNIGTTNVPYSRHALHNYIADVENDIYIGGQPHMMTENHEQEIAGVIGLTDLNLKHQRTEMSIIIMELFCQKGYTQAAISALIDYVRNGLYLKQAYAVVGVDNEVSTCYLSSIGSTNDSILEEWSYCDGQYKDARVMQLFI